MENMMKRALKSSVQQNKKVLKELVIVSLLTGINITAPSRIKYLIRILNVSLLILASFGIYGEYYYVYRHIDDSFSVYIESIFTSFQGVISMIKMVYCLFIEQKLYNLLNTAETGKIIEQLEIFDMDIATTIKLQIRDDIIDILKKSWILIRRQLTFYLVAIIMIVSSYIFAPAGMNTYHKIIGTANYTARTANPVTFPMWESKASAFPYFEMQYILAASINYIAGAAAFSFDGLFIVATMHGMALLQVLHVIIRYSTHQSMQPLLRVNYLRHCINHFNRTYQYYTEVNTLFSMVSLAQFCISLFILGMVLFQANIGLQTDIKIFLKMVSYIMAAGFEVFIYCYNGQKLTTESEMLNFSWYDCDWYEESKEFKQLIKMMILRGNRDMPMEAGGFTTMSLMTFVSLMQTSASYFLLLKNVSQEEV